MGSYFLKPNQEVTLSLYNGTFEKSENIITRDRMLDASLVYNGNRFQIDDSQWIDKDTTITQFKFSPVEEGTYLTGVSTKARTIELAADKFNDYLKHDEVLDMLEYRKSNDLLDQDAVESYQSLYLKAHYPLEFMVGVINNGGGFYRTELYVHEARMKLNQIQQITRQQYLSL